MLTLEYIKLFLNKYATNLMDQKNLSKIKEICSYKKLSVEEVIYFVEGSCF